MEPLPQELIARPAVVSRRVLVPAAAALLLCLG
jgi:hypothetical protein